MRRAGREKLGVDLEPGEPVGGEAGMTDWTARVSAGEPAVPQPGANTQYTDLHWGGPPNWSRPPARARSAVGCCCAPAV